MSNSWDIYQFPVILLSGDLLSDNCSLLRFCWKQRLRMQRDSKCFWGGVVLKSVGGLLRRYSWMNKWFTHKTSRITQDDVSGSLLKDIITNYYMMFLAVTWQLNRWRCHWLTHWLTDSVSHLLFFLTLKSDPRDQWPLRQILMTIFDANFWWQFLMTIFDDNIWWQFSMTIFDDNS